MMRVGVLRSGRAADETITVELITKYRSRKHALPYSDTLPDYCVLGRFFGVRVFFRFDFKTWPPDPSASGEIVPGEAEWPKAVSRYCLGVVFLMRWKT